MKKESISVLGAGFACVDIIKTDNCDSIMPGGTAANVLSILSLLGIQSVFLCAQYNDELGNWLSGSLLNRGVQLCYFASSHMPVPRVIEYLDSSGQHEFRTSCPVCGRELIKTVLPTAKQINALPINRINETNLFYYDRISEGIRLLSIQNQKGWNFYEPNSCRVYKTFLESAKRTDILKFSQDRIPNAYLGRLIDDLQESSVQLLIVSMGKSGLRFSYRDTTKRLCDWIYLEAEPLVYSVDDSGAGDWMTAVFLYQFLQEYPFFTEELSAKSIMKMLKTAKRIAGYQCGFLGAQGIMYNETAMKKLSYELKTNSSLIVDQEYCFSGECECCKL